MKSPADHSALHFTAARLLSFYPNPGCKRVKELSKCSSAIFESLAQKCYTSYATAFLEPSTQHFTICLFWVLSLLCRTAVAPFGALLDLHAFVLSEVGKQRSTRNRLPFTPVSHNELQLFVQGPHWRFVCVPKRTRGPGHLTGGTGPLFQNKHQLRGGDFGDGSHSEWPFVETAPLLHLHLF